MEWVEDWYNDGYWKKEGEVTDPTGPAGGSKRVNRGGSWNDPAEDCRSAYRSSDSPGVSLSRLGFRLAFSIVE
jgi:formylglycine-generating enzyme required for sulfatase activity